MGTEWVEPTIAMTRILIGDTVPDYEYTDERLQAVATTCAVLVQREALLAYTYVVDISTSDIEPDPGAIPDDAYMSLIAYKSACVIMTSEYRTASNKAFNVKDGPSTIDGRGVAENKLELAKGACKYYDEYKAIQSANGSNMGGYLVVGPFNCDCVTDGSGRSNREGC